MSNTGLMHVYIEKQLKAVEFTIYCTALTELYWPVQIPTLDHLSMYMTYFLYFAQVGMKTAIVCRTFVYPMTHTYSVVKMQGFAD